MLDEGQTIVAAQTVESIGHLCQVVFAVILINWAPEATAWCANRTTRHAGIEVRDGPIDDGPGGPARHLPPLYATLELSGADAAASVGCSTVRRPLQPGE